MNTYKAIEKGKRSAYPNPEYVTFYNRVNDAIWIVGLAPLNIDTPDYATFEEHLVMMVKITQRNDTKDITRLMNEADTARDHAFQYFQGMVKASLFSMNEAIKSHAALLDTLLEKYKDMIYVKADQQTALMLGLFNDLKAAPYNAAVTALGLDNAVIDMRAKNDEYETLNKQRIDKKEEIKLPPAKDVRAVMDPLYDKFCTLIEASYMLSTDAENTLAIGKLITDLSAIAEQASLSYKLSQAQKEKEPTSSETGEETVPADPNLPAE